jgi:MFS family permease
VGYALIAAGLLLCLIGKVPLFLAGAVCFGLGVPFVVLALGTALHLYTPARLQGRANAAVSSATGVTQAASIAAGAALIDVLGYQVMYLVMACTAVLCAASVLVRRVPRPEISKSVADIDTDTDTDTAVITEAAVVTDVAGQAYAAVDTDGVRLPVTVPAPGSSR